MKKIAILTLLLTTPLACSKPDSAAPVSATSAKAAGAEAPKTAAAAAPPKAAFEQKGIPAGKVVVGYMQDAADPTQCAALTDDPAKKEEFAKNAGELAKMMKGTIVPSCPTDNVVGTCSAGFGILVNYSGPKWTKEAAQKHCVAQPHATWLD